jgi:hypothetical protein
MRSLNDVFPCHPFPMIERYSQASQSFLPLRTQYAIRGKILSTEKIDLFYLLAMEELVEQREARY